MNTSSTLRARFSWLAFARAAWVVIAVLAVGMSVAGIPYAVEAFSHPGTMLTPATADLLRAQGVPLESYATFTVTLRFVTGLVWFLIGLLIFLKAEGWIALEVSLTLITFGNNNPMRVALGEGVPFWSLPAQLLTVLSWVFFALFFAVFPNGRFVPRWVRWAVLAWAVLMSLGSLIQDGLPDPVPALAFSAFFFIFPGAQIYRYLRVSTPAERLQTRWVLFGVAVLLVTYVSLILLSIPLPEIMNSPYLLAVGNLVPVVIPLSIGIAILRSRLFDIDILIRRTLVYSVLTITLALVYFGSVVLLQQIFRAITGEGQAEIVTVLSTLAIAVFSIPLRQRVQRIIDRRFYRRKYDAAKTLAAFGATARDEVNLESLSEQLVAVVQNTMEPESVGLWLRQDRRSKTAERRGEKSDQAEGGRS